MTLALRTGSGGAQLEIRDEGIGMDRETLARLGEPFYREDRARSRAQGGTGLGVAFCFAVAKAHGASLNFISERGKGTAVKVCFPSGLGE